MEKYSALMSVYDGDRADYLKLAIESMLNQTIKPDQFVIIVDGFVKKSLNEVLSEYRDNNIFTIITLEKNSGLGKALDIGIKYCKNNLVARMDSDDISVPDRCEKQLKIFEKYPSVSIVSGIIGEFVDNPDDIVAYRTVPETHSDIRQRMRIRSGFNHSAVMYKKEDVILCGGYGELRRKQDHDLFSRMLNNGCRGYNIQEVLVYFRANEDAINRKKSMKNVNGYIKAQWKCFLRREVSIFDLAYVICGEIFILIMPKNVVRACINRFFRG